LYFPSHISLQNRWAGTNGLGTLGALSAELLARRFSRKSLENLNQPGFEPTSSRAVSEATLPFTTSNFFAFRQNRAGRKIEQSSVATAAHRLTDEVTLLRTIPAS